MRRLAGFAVAACAAMTVLPQIALAGLPGPDRQPRSVGRLAAGQPVLLVTFADRPDRETAQTRLAGLGTVRPSVPEVGVWEVAVTDAAGARAAALGRPGVERAEWSLERRIHALTDPRRPATVTRPLQVLPEPTDPLYADAAKQWGLRLGTWSIGLSAGPRPTIAILDSGIDSTHEEWRANGVLVFPRSTFRRVDRAEDISVFGHGTHVAGIAAAPANGVGVVGVSPAGGDPSDPYTSKVIPVQISDSQGRSTDSTMMRGIRWAVNHGAKVINISSGGPGYSQAFQDTIDWAFRRGALIVASVGNEGDQENFLNYPAGYDHVIGVGAECDRVVDVNFGCPVAFARAKWSNSNASVDVIAPGVNVASSIPLAVADGRFAPGYGLKDGTSMAAPYVAGAAALVFGAHPGATPFQVTRLLESTAYRAVTGQLRTSTDGWGQVNPLAAAQAQAPVDDLAEPNDDVRWLPKSLDFRPGRTPVTITAWADANDDRIDAYPVVLRKGERLKVTITTSAGKLGVFVFRPGVQSLARQTEKQFDAKLLGRTRRPTPSVRTVVVRARESGRHLVVVGAFLRGGEYSLRISRR
jgi:subtilisin family serine protease